jgi:hypothetical protein
MALAAGAALGTIASFVAGTVGVLGDAGRAAAG